MDYMKSNVRQWFRGMVICRVGVFFKATASLWMPTYDTYIYSVFHNGCDHNKHNSHCLSCRLGPSTVFWNTNRHKWLNSSFRLLFMIGMPADFFTWWWVSEALAECSEPDAAGCPIMIWVWSWRQISQRWTMLCYECQPGKKQTTKLAYFYI